MSKFVNGQHFHDSHFYVTECQEDIAKNDKPYLRLQVRNLQFEGKAIIWDSDRTVSGNKFFAKTFVEMGGIVEEFKGVLSIKVSNIRILNDSEIRMENIIPSLSIQQKEMNMLEIESYIDAISNNRLRKLCQEVFYVIPDLRKNFKESPAATKNHHALCGGLAQHTLSMIKTCSKLVSQYPFLSSDLLIAGCLWHDIGKVEEFESILDPSYSINGNLLGHMGIAQKYLDETIFKISQDYITLDGGKSEEVNLLRHIIYSHHGKHEYGSQVTPVIPEAYVIHIVDTLDATLYVFFEFLKSGATNELVDVSSTPVISGRKIYKHSLLNEEESYNKIRLG